jgi:hypothetical protein
MHRQENSEKENESEEKEVLYFIIFIRIKPRRVSKNMTISGQNSHHKIYRYGDTN